MRNSQGLGLQIIVDGRPLQEYDYQGRTYIAAPWNTDFQIRLLTPRIRGYKFPYKRFLAVCSVDGLDIMTGKRATPNSGGYVMTPAETIDDNDIPGFRLNSNEVAAFHFGDRRDSYAAQMDKPENVGVISVIYFSEYDPEPRYESLTKGGAKSAGGTRSMGTRGGGATRGGHDMGTEFGQRVEHRVGSTSFDRDREVARFTLEYASRESLIEANIIPAGSPLGQVNAFDEIPGCQPPKGWRG